MECRYCGKRIRGTYDSTCKHCGQRVDECPYCKTRSEPDVSKCPLCGRRPLHGSRAEKCRSCGTPLRGVLGLECPKCDKPANECPYCQSGSAPDRSPCPSCGKHPPHAAWLDKVDYLLAIVAFLLRPVTRMIRLSFGILGIGFTYAVVVAFCLLVLGFLVWLVIQAFFHPGGTPPWLPVSPS